jgi:hypothetical protein
MDEKIEVTRVAKAMRGAVNTMQANFYQNLDPEVIAWG